MNSNKPSPVGGSRAVVGRRFGCITLTPEQAARRLEGIRKACSGPRRKDWVDAMRRGIQKYLATHPKRKWTEKQTALARARMTGKKLPEWWVKKAAENHKGWSRGFAHSVPGMAKGENHKNATKGMLRAPSGEIHEYVNLMEWVRTHESLLLPETVRWTVKSGKVMTLSCAAYSGLNRVRNGHVSRCRGWTKVSICERRFNDGNDLLARSRPNDKVSDAP